MTGWLFAVAFPWLMRFALYLSERRRAEVGHG